jgi:hypothetical protein
MWLLRKWQNTVHRQQHDKRRASLEIAVADLLQKIFSAFAMFASFYVF